MDPAAEPGRLRRLACALAPLVLAGAVWRPLVRNYFHGDDFFHLYALVDLPLAQWLLMPFGGHVQLLRNAVFSLCYAAFGTAPAPWFAVVLVTHLLNVALFFRLLRATGVGLRLATLGAAWWGAARVLEGALGWYSVYGQVLVATLALPVVTGALGHARRGSPVGAREVLRWDAVLLVACTAFGVGLGIALAFPFAAGLVLRRRGLGRGAVSALLALPPAVVLLWIGAHALYAALFPSLVGWTSSFVLTSLAAWKVVPVMVFHLLGVGVTALLHPFGNTFADYPGPRAWGLGASYVVAIAAGAALSPPATRRTVAALLLLAIGCYVIIAVGRAGVWNVPGIPVFGAVEPRYHYVGTAFLAAALVTALGGLAARVRMPPLAGDALLAAALAGLVVLHQRSGWAIDHHDADRRAVADLLATTRLSTAWAPAGQPAVMPNRGFFPFLLPPPAFAGWASAFVVFAPPDLIGRVQFTDPSPEAHRMARPGSRLARVLAP